MKRRIADFGVVVYNNEGQVEVAFNKAKKVPKAYGNFVACIEIACLSAIQKVMARLEKGKESGEVGNDASDKRNDADDKGNEA